MKYMWHLWNCFEPNQICLLKSSTYICVVMNFYKQTVIKKDITNSRTFVFMTWNLRWLNVIIF